MSYIKELSDKQAEYVNSTLNLIASENYPFASIKELNNIVLYSKYAEGEISKRYYQGCKYVDEIESTAQNEFNKLFNCKFSNVQVSSGTLANLTVFFNLLNIGDTIVSLNLSDGGHLTHGFKSTLVGKLFKIINYNSINNCKLDYDQIQKLIFESNCKLVILGYSSCTFDIDYEKVRNMINKCNRKIWLLADIAHISGLVSSGLMNHPFPFADIITTTTHKQLRGPRGGAIGWNDENLKLKSFPLLQGGPDMLSLAGKAEAFLQCNENKYKTYCEQILKNSKFFYFSLKKYFNVIHGETQNHINLIRVDDAKIFANNLEKNGIIVNTNLLCNDNIRPSGIRLGTCALTTRGATEKDFDKISYAMHLTYLGENDKAIEIVREVINNLMII